MNPIRWWEGRCEPLPSLDAISSLSWEVCYGGDMEQGKRTTRTIPPQLAVYFGDDSGFWSKRTGIPGLAADPTLHGGGIHVMAPESKLAVHLDGDFHPVLPAKRRALSVVAFLNPKWESAWGGALILCDPSGEAVTRILPEPGKVIAFECTDLSFHGVEEVTGPMERVTAATAYWRWAGRTRAMFIPDRD